MRKIGRLPKDWERAFGYRGRQRWLAVALTPEGVDSYWIAGPKSEYGEWPAWEELKDALKLGDGLLQALQASHVLLCDLQFRAVYLAEWEEARPFVFGGEETC